MALLITSLYFALNLSGQRELRLATELSRIGVQVAGYEKIDSKGAGLYQDPGAQTEISRIYSSPSGESVEMYVGFSGRQEADKRLHSPKLRFPYGWNYVWIESTDVAITGNRPISANWMLTQNSQIHVLVLYWYQTGAETFAGEFEKRLSQILNSVFRARSDSAVVRLATVVTDTEKMEQAKSRLAAFAADLYPRLQQILPQ
jgi:EpsI family protein